MTDPGAAGRALGSRYTLVERIGQGASGEVWRALDRQTGQQVAAKLLWPQHASDPEILTRFINERSVLLGLDHRNIVKVHDFVVEGQDLAIVMDLIEGPSVGSLLKQQRTLPASMAVPLAAAVLDALDSAHSQGVIHRDVKPDNIMLAHAGQPSAEDVRLADFGIAGIMLDEAAPATELIGTPNYMPPELVSYGKFGPASDVYAVGVVLYELLGGRTPFAGPGTNVTVAMRQVNSAPPRLPIDDALWRVIDLMLAKDPAQRSSAATTASLLRALPAAVLDGPALAPQPAPENWVDSRSVLPDKSDVERALGGVASGDVDASGEDAGMDATSLRPMQPMGRPTPMLAEADPADDSGATMMKAAARPDARVAPRRPVETGMSTRAKVLIGVGVTVAVIAAAVLLWVTGVFESDDTEPVVEITTTPAHVNGTSTPAGLRMDLDAAYDDTEQMTALTVTLSAAPNAPIQGDVLLATPGLDGGSDCAEVAEEDGVVQRVRASADGLDITCGYRLTDVVLAAGQSMTVPLSVDLDLVDDEGKIPDDYRDWLNSVQESTDSALTSVVGTDFALQRVDGIRVEPTSVTLTGSATPVPYRVVATWAGGVEGSETELFTQDTTDGMEVELLTQLTGGNGLDGVSVSSCNAAQVIGIRVLAEQPESSCHVTVGIGALNSGEASFGIRMR
ncbi:serine/threonine-protein kinase [Cellulomonas sp. NPDC089187]|uniref:serine/threonine-protein kinase n=1 Tax=Cellulomonas sp. NPDC089187 TaxID=3154970 RepID=UPI0034479218